ncbi:uncharacterized protein BN612_00426 [Phocaeicola coprophilus CAG:333]|uniref:hypothetical protein n=2 Tax=Phocaeicola coprophilus TaxID=387090 RepID=UPI000337082A|nr:hypothetical protein [Phocaeicola coprophilus]CDC57256.1 uncharacterized protein BN612_00426 [Phocaeicola coprophilus CAG:333]
MRMKNFRKYLCLILFLFLAGIMSSCVKNLDTAGLSETVTLNFQLAGLSRVTTDAENDFENALNTLRILITDEAGVVLANSLLENVTSDSPIRIVGIPRSKIRVYAFANEESMGRNFDTESLLKDIDENTSYNIGNGNGKLEPDEILARAWDRDDQTTFFPLTLEEAIKKDEGLPMTGCYGVKKSDEYHDDGNPLDLTNEEIIEKNITIHLVRCVAKIVVNLTNNTSSSIDLNSVMFGRFFPNKVYYYRHTENDVQTPNNTELIYHNFDKVSRLLVGTNVNVLTYYLYPSSTDNNNDDYRFSIALNTTNLPAINRQYKEFFKTEDSNRTILGRNTILTVNGTINPGSFTVSSNLQVKIEDWNSKGDMDIEFN